MKMNYSAEELLERRLAGILPEIAIAGDIFIVDWRLKELRLKDHPEKRIDMKIMPLDVGAEHYQFFYDTKLKQLVRLKDIKGLPKRILLVKIPNEKKLDPVGVAREFGLADTALLGTYPLSNELKATTIPLTESFVAQLIRESTKPPRWNFKKGKGL